jgi:hypothetical protein
MRQPAELRLDADRCDRPAVTDRPDDRARRSASPDPTKRVASTIDVSTTPGQIAVTLTRPCQSARRLCENASTAAFVATYADSVARGV